MTLVELQAQRDTILKQLSQPQQMQSGSSGLTNRNIQDLQRALGTIDGEIAKLSASSAATGNIVRFYTGEGL